MSAQADALSGKSSLVTNVLEAASASKPEESLEAAWERMQRSSTAQRVDVSYEQSKIEDKSVAAQDARLARFGLGRAFGVVHARLGSESTVCRWEFYRRSLCDGVSGVPRRSKPASERPK